MSTPRHHAIPAFSVMGAALEAAYLARGVRAEEAVTLFHAYEDIPPTMPAGTPLAGLDWIEYRCRACAEAILADARAQGWNGEDAGGVPVSAWGADREGEGPAWCPTCGVYLRVGFTVCSIDDVVAHGKTTRSDLPAICEGLFYYGDGLPLRCCACPWSAALLPGWEAPAITLDVERWAETAHVPVSIRCCGCTTWVVQPARLAKGTVEAVERWLAFRDLAWRAYTRYGRAMGKPINTKRS